MENQGAADSRRPSFLPAAGGRRALLAAVGWGIFLLALTSWPSPPEVPVVSSIPNFDKLIHAFLYGVQGFLVLRAVAWPPESRSAWLQALAVAGALAVFATLDELHQHWIPGRSMDGLDALADTAGAFVGALGAARISRPAG